MAKLVRMHVLMHPTRTEDNFLLVVKANDIVSVQHKTLSDGTRATLVCLESETLLLRVSHDFEDMVSRWEDALC